MQPPCGAGAGRHVLVLLRLPPARVQHRSNTATIIAPADRRPCTCTNESAPQCQCPLHPKHAAETAGSHCTATYRHVHVCGICEAARRQLRAELLLSPPPAQHTVNISRMKKLQTTNDARQATRARSYDTGPSLHGCGCASPVQHHSCAEAQRHTSKPPTPTFEKAWPCSTRVPDGQSSNWAGAGEARRRLAQLDKVAAAASAAAVCQLRIKEVVAGRGRGRGNVALTPCGHSNQALTGTRAARPCQALRHTQRRQS